MKACRNYKFCSVFAWTLHANFPHTFQIITKYTANHYFAQNYWQHRINNWTDLQCEQFTHYLHDDFMQIPCILFVNNKKLYVFPILFNYVHCFKFVNCTKSALCAPICGSHTSSIRTNYETHLWRHNPFIPSSSSTSSKGQKFKVQVQGQVQIF